MRIEFDAFTKSRLDQRSATLLVCEIKATILSMISSLAVAMTATLALLAAGGAAGSNVVVSLPPTCVFLMPSFCGCCDDGGY